MSSDMPRTKTRGVRRGLCQANQAKKETRDRREQLGSEESESNGEKWSVIEVWNPTRGEPASEAIANCEVISSPCLRLPSLATPSGWSERLQVARSCKKIYNGHERSVSTG